MAATRYVREADGQWEVLEEGAKRSATRADTKARAVEQARAIVRRKGGGQILVVNESGKIERAARVGRARRKKAA